MIGLCGHYCGAKKTRGLCSTCYRRYNLQIQKGILTWKELEDKGISEPMKKTSGMPFLSNNEKSK